MIFKDKLDEKTKIIRPEIDRLLDIANKNQTYFADLLLIHINGFYQSDTLIWNANHPERTFNPHVIGPGSEGHSEHAHYSFIHKYRTTHIHPMTHSDYIKQFVMEKFDKEISDRNTKLMDEEETIIQLEMLIYLKIWEADMIIKKLYQFVRLLGGQHYDWYFKIAESSRDNDCTGTRQDIIRKLIRDNLKAYSPTLYQLIKDTYKTQIRNSIAHSNYSFQGRHIHPNNYVKEDPHSQIQSLPFDNWIDMFHNTLVLYNEYIRMDNLINDHYAQIAGQNNNSMEIRITEKDGKQYPLYLDYRPELKDWHYKHNE